MFEKLCSHLLACGRRAGIIDSMSESCLTLLLLLFSLGQAEPDAAAADREARMQFFREHLAKFTLHQSGETEPAPLRAEPVLRYSNPERQSGSTDGAAFLWLAGQRPIAVISLSIRRPN